MAISSEFEFFGEGVPVKPFKFVYMLKFGFDGLLAQMEFLVYHTLW